nr:LuxR family transcriptional regulator [uncultured Nocardioides sp.]
MAGSTRRARTRDAWSGSAHGLVARDAELGELRDALAGGGRVATLLGVAGAGKTSVVRAVTAAVGAQGWRVVHVRGYATEQLLGWSTLLDLVDSPGSDAAGVGGETEHEDLAADLRTCLTAGSAGDGSAALRLRRDVHRWLLGLAPDRPLLVTVDDAHWVDESSLRVLTYVANRVDGTDLSFLFASRADAPPLGLDDQHVVRLRPLDSTDSYALLRRSAPVLEPLVNAAVVERAAGNPLALLELARTSAIAAPAGTEAPGALPAAVEAAFAADLPLLPERTREVLLLVAAGGGDVRVLDRAVTGGADALEPAERAGLVRVHGHRVDFRHPLAQSTVYGAATSVQRRAAHARLADLYGHDDDRRIWHLSSSIDAPDEDVALALTATARSLLVRGAQREAAEAMVRAAELTESPGLRDDRLLEAMSLTTAAGHVNRIAHLAELLRAQTSSPLARAHAAHYLGYALAQSMRQNAAQAVLEEALSELIKLDDEAGWAALTTLASLTYQTCQRQESLARWLEQYDALTPGRLADNPITVAARAWIRTALDPLARPRDVKQLLREAPPRLPGDLPPYDRAAHDMLLGATAWLLDEHETALRHLSAASDRMQRSGHATPVVQNTMALGQVQFDMGHYDAADASGRLMIDIGEAEVLVYYQSVGRELRSRVAAVRGRSDEALAQLDRLLAEVEPGQSASLEANLIVSRANALVGLRDHEAAHQQLRALFDAAARPLHPHVSFRALGDVVSAAVRVGRGAEVVDLVRSAEARIPDLPGERMTRTLSRAKALVDPDPDVADALFRRAVDEPGSATWPFERASALLDHGLWLRRQHRAGEAREQLRAAHQLFLRLGALPWAAMAEVELRAAGVRVDGDAESADRLAGLTAQEREIVLLAATGLSNKEIGEALFLSPRTVGAHLYHAFPKLGVTARTQLRDLVADVVAQATDGGEGQI